MALPRPSEDSLDFKPWHRVNNVIIGWILAVFYSSIAKSVLWYNTSREIWCELDERYGQSSAAQLFSLQEEINKLNQSNDANVAEVFTKLKSLWDELDSLEPLPTCICANSSCNLTQQFYQLQ